MGVAALATVASAQGENKTVWGIRAGLNVANIHMSDLDGEAKPDSRTGFHAGVSFQQPLGKITPLYLESGLYMSAKGFKQKASFEGESFEATAKPMYLQIPILLSYHFNTNSVSFQPYAGFYYGLGIGGKLESKYSYDGETASVKTDLFKETKFEEEGETYTEDQKLKRSDFGMRFGLGVTIKQHYYIGAGYEMSLSNIAKDKEIYGKMKNRNFFVSVGYNF